MSHEIDLLIVKAFFLLMALTGGFIGSHILELSVLTVMCSTISAGIGLGSIILGLAGAYYEMTTLSSFFKGIESGGGSTSQYQAALGLGIAAYFLFVGFTFALYLRGNYEATLEMALRLIQAGVGFSIAFVMMLVGAIIARFKRKRERT